MIGPAMNLDELYGRLLPPVAPKVIETHELKFTPQSLFELTSTSVEELKAFAVAQQGDDLIALATRGFPILWIIGESDRVFLAFEEVIHSLDGAKLCCMPRGVVPGPGKVKLGHPSLLQGGIAARIGGELFFDYGLETGPEWVLTNDSGRYGKRPHQTVAHLAAAARKFKQIGLSVSYYFVPG